jgi:hypothetical protein
MPYEIGEEVDLVPLPLENPDRTTEINKRRGTPPGWGQDMEAIMLGRPTGWQIAGRIAAGVYALNHPNFGNSGY